LDQEDFQQAVGFKVQLLTSGISIPAETLVLFDSHVTADDCLYLGISLPATPSRPAERALRALLAPHVPPNPTTQSPSWLIR